MLTYRCFPYGDVRGKRVSEHLCVSGYTEGTTLLVINSSESALITAAPFSMANVNLFELLVAAAVLEAEYRRALSWVKEGRYTGQIGHA